MTKNRYTQSDIFGVAEYDPMREPRYTQIATFMRAPLAETLDGVDIGLIGVPTDLNGAHRRYHDV
jgi:guanidinopropionase